MIDPERIRALNAAPPRNKASHVLYVMRAARRAEGNHALWYAASEADRLGLALEVAVRLGDTPDELERVNRWRRTGIAELAETLVDAGMGLSFLEAGDRAETRDAALVVLDRRPDRLGLAEAAELAARSEIRVVEVDGESVVPEAVASDRREWSARTFRPKAEAALAWYAERQLPPLPVPVKAAPRRPLAPLLSAPTEQFGPPPGPKAARAALRRFIAERLERYDTDRNDPTIEGTSGLSAYLSAGFLSPLEAIAAARAHGGPGYPAFAEQLVIRRELCRNFVRFCPDAYDAWDGLPAWSRATLEAASADRRAYLYDRPTFEAAQTHDPYWNAAQRSLLTKGSIHNYMRMYWGKMLLAWSASPREAFATALYLNDRYALDGRDPNGWAGVAWCFGLHDRPWPARPVFGTVRSMTAAGLKRKFDAERYARGSDTKP